MDLPQACYRSSFDGNRTVKESIRSNLTLGVDGAIEQCFLDRWLIGCECFQFIPGKPSFDS